MFEKRRQWSSEVAAVSGVPATHLPVENRSRMQVKNLHALYVVSFAVKWTPPTACDDALVTPLAEYMRARESSRPQGYNSAKSTHSVGLQRFHEVQRSPVEARGEAGDTVH
ncbi:unnamed protein product, partial [Ixodes persulcatus]